MEYEIHMTVTADVNDDDRTIKSSIESTLDEHGIHAQIKDIKPLTNNDSLAFNIVGYSKDKKCLVCDNGFSIGCSDGCSFDIDKIKELAKSK